MREIERGFVAFNRILIGAMMAVMFLLVFTNVMTRYGFGFSINWAEEISRFIMIWCTFLAAGLALREGRHVAIDVLQDLLGERLRRLIRMAVFAGLLAFALGGVYFGVRFAIFGWNTETMVTQIPRGMAFLAIHLLLFARRFLERDWEGVNPGVEDVNGEPEAG